MKIGPARAMPRGLKALLAISLVIVKAAGAQTEGCEPVADRAGREFGCFITAREELGRCRKIPCSIGTLTPSLLVLRLTRPARGAARWWSPWRLGLFTIAEAGWRPTTGERIASADRPLIGADACGRLHEGVFRPGMRSSVTGIPSRGCSEACVSSGGPTIVVLRKSSRCPVWHGDLSEATPLRVLRDRYPR
jgi:hypothetical protein